MRRTAFPVNTHEKRTTALASKDTEIRFGVIQHGVNDCVGTNTKIHTRQDPKNVAVMDDTTKYIRTKRTKDGAIESTAIFPFTAMDDCVRAHSKKWQASWFIPNFLKTVERSSLGMVRHERH